MFSRIVLFGPADWTRAKTKILIATDKRQQCYQSPLPLKPIWITLSLWLPTFFSTSCLSFNVFPYTSDRKPVLTHFSGRHGMLTFFYSRSRHLLQSPSSLQHVHRERVSQWRRVFLIAFRRSKRADCLPKTVALIAHRWRPEWYNSKNFFPYKLR